ncbi:YgaP-like transmembrane domain [Leptospira wolffii]|uniref:YgaP-like transmembrane domain n=1 Tax=Leptospira wolffii TaxID=409998 RepID=UPI0003530915|nr:YgaP-like transmembrane domain [Leptospira wolffii]EPG65022.1 PF11127 family protein [Leptospira wolffii serovar Khorat str. Khorat-H2]
MESRTNGTWYLERVLFLIAGSFSLIGLGLGLLVDKWGFALNALVGVNMVVFSLTGFCPMAILLRKLGISEKCGAYKGIA